MAEEKPKLTLILPLGGPGRKTPGQWWQKCEHSIAPGVGVMEVTQCDDTA